VNLNPVRAALVTLAVLVVACSDDHPVAPDQSTNDPPIDQLVKSPRFDHGPSFVPPTTVDANNYVLNLDPAVLLSGSYKGTDVLFGGGLAYGNAPTQAFIFNTRGWAGPGFVSSGLPVEVNAPGPVANHQTVTLLIETTDDNLGLSNPIGLGVVRETFAYGAPDDDYVIIKYTLANTTAAPVTGLRIGEILDSDVDPWDQNVVEFVAADELAQTTTDLGVTTVSHGHILLSHTVTGYRGFCSPRFYVCPNPDPRLLPEWFNFLSGGIVGPGPLGPSDIRELLTTGPVDIPAGGSVVLFTALLGGDDVADLNVNVAAARAKFAALPQAAKDPFPLIGVEVSFRKFKAHSSGDAVATLTFGSLTEAGLFDDSHVACDGVSPREANAVRSKVTLKFNVTDFDTQLIRDGDRIVCAGKLTDGTLYSGTTILAVEQKLLK
jgi:hypothetical protein